MAKALSDAQRRALLAFPVRGPYGAAAFSWAREWYEITQAAGQHVGFATISVLIRYGYVERDPRSPALVRMTSAGREHRREIFRLST